MQSGGAAWPPMADMGWRAGARNARVFIDAAPVKGAHSVQLQAAGSWKEKIFRCCVSLPVLFWCCHGLFSTWTAWTGYCHRPDLRPSYCRRYHRECNSDPAYSNSRVLCIGRR